MAATDMKFGPEWLRALSDGVPNVTSQTQTPPTTPAPPKYKLAEYRYGREEMLALFNKNCKPPEKLEEFPHIFVDKIQMPLALVAMSEEEQRLWTRVNSDVVLRLMGKSSGTGPERERGVSERGGVSIRAGRGSSLSDRGRGRGRGGYYQRGTSYDEGGDSPPERRDFRTRTFERNSSVNDDMNSSRDKKYERGFSRGGGSGSGGGPEDNGLQSRKNLNSRSSSVENWRTAGRGEDREGWRTAGRMNDNWNRNNSWRSVERERDYEHEGEHLERNGPHKKYSNYQKDKNSSDLWDDIEDNDRRNSLPEWSLDDGPECDAKVGTFDASGAFREINNDEEETKSDEAEQDDQNERQNNCEEWTNIDRNRKKSSQNTRQDSNEVQNESKTENMSQNVEQTIKRDDRNNMVDNTIKMSSHSSNNSQQQNQPKQQLHQQLQSQQSQPPSTQTPSNPLTKLLTNDTSNQHNMKSPLEEDGFAHLEKEAENMVAQWTADEDQKDNHEMEGNVKGMIVLPVHHEDALKWFYRDPQGEIQGPFTPHEMYDWFTAGYFAMDLLVRRGCDEVFSQLGELFKLWERIPFLQVQGSAPPPLRTSSSNTSLLASIPVSLSSASHSSVHNIPPPHQHILHQQFHQQQQQQQQPPQQQTIYMNQHNVDMQSQLRQLLAQLKKQDGFSDLSQQQQQEVLVQRYVNMERQRQASLQPSIPSNRSAEDSQINPLEALSNLRIQSQRPIQMVNNSGHVQSIWDINSSVMSVSAVEEMQRKEQERKELEEKRRAYEEEQNRRKLEQEEIQRKLKEELLQKKLEEERLRKQEEELRRREEEERLRLEEEHNRLEEERRIVEEQRRRQEELMRLEEYTRRKQEEAERRRQIEAEKERQRQLKEIEQQRIKEMERLRQMQQQEAIIKLQQQQQEQNRKVWGGQEQSQRQQQNPLSLNEIQRLQEEKEREERQRQLQMQQQQMQALFAAQQQQQQQQQNKQSLTWATPPYQQQNVPVKTLAEIQREEAEKVAKQKQVEQKKQQIQVTNNVPNAGIWNNANNQLFGQNVAGKPNNSTNSSAVGFWEPESRKVQTNRANESALHSMQSNTKGNNQHVQIKANSRNKKDEESVLRLFENQRRQNTDEFTQWCNEALSKYQSTVDIPTFITFLKDVESPFEINDYVRSYLGESKDVKDFAKQFIEKRSYFRNRAKKEASEELMWGPAPAITPSANKLNPSPAINQTSNSGDNDMGFIQAGKKKKKGKRVVDNSILGFTVQADPDRINAGEIEQID